MAIESNSCMEIGPTITLIWSLGMQHSDNEGCLQFSNNFGLVKVLIVVNPNKSRQSIKKLKGHEYFCSANIDVTDVTEQFIEFNVL